MKHYKQNITAMVTGMVIGASLVGGAAAGVVAEPTWQKIYVDGQQVSMTAYNIAGNNYVRLRDIGQQVGFNVYWSDGVQIDTDAPYTGIAPVREATALLTDITEPHIVVTGDVVGCHGHLLTIHIDVLPCGFCHDSRCGSAHQRCADDHACYHGCDILLVVFHREAPFRFVTQSNTTTNGRKLYAFPF